MPKKGRGTAGPLDPLKLPAPLQTALFALYGHYEQTFALWQQAGIGVRPCFIVVCQNTAISKLVHDFLAGFWQEDVDGTRRFTAGRLPLFRNFDDSGEPLARPHTLLIDSEQLESGEILDKGFHAAAADELARFRREIVERKRDAHAADNLSDADILREVMNTVGKPGTLGGGVRCVVSVSMLTEGWDANTVTHVFGVRAFGTQLLCEQVIGRALRRQSYDLAPDGLLPVEYADVFGIPFDFTAKPVVAPPQQPRTITVVKAVSPDRDHLEIRFPRVEGYRTELPAERITAAFTEDSVLDSGWEGEFCRAAEAHPRVKAYVKNHALGFEVPYRVGSVAKRYRPDFLVLVDDGRPDPLHLVVEIKGFRREDVKDKRNAMLGSWIPGVNRLGTHGRWAFAEFRDVWEIETGPAAAIAAAFGDLVAP